MKSSLAMSKDSARDVNRSNRVRFENPDQISVNPAQDIQNPILTDLAKHLVKLGEDV